MGDHNQILNLIRKALHVRGEGASLRSLQVRNPQ